MEQLIAEIEMAIPTGWQWLVCKKKVGYFANIYKEGDVKSINQAVGMDYTAALNAAFHLYLDRYV